MVETTRTYQIDGGSYTAVQNADGTWNLLDVPICGEIPKGAKENAQAIGKAWLEGAVAKFKERQDEKYWPPLHIDHHQIAANVRRAGTYCLRRVGQMTYEGKPTWVAFGDLARIPDHIFNMIERGDLPYLSVELGSWDDGEFASIALMEHDAPFFRFPNLSIGDKVFHPTAMAEKYESVGPVKGFAATEKGALVLCKFGGGIKLAAEGGKEGEEGEGKEKPPPKDDEGAEEPAAGGEEASGTGAQMLAMLNQVSATLQQMNKTLMILAKAQSGVGGAGFEEDDKKGGDMAPVDQRDSEKDKAEKEKAAKAKASVDVNVELGALSGKVAALLEKDAARERKDKLALMVQKAEGELAGWHIGASVKADLLLMAEKGEDAINAFVKSYKTNVPKEPPATFEEFERRGGTQLSADPEAEKILLKYQNRGPEALEAARRFSALYDQAVARRMTDAGREAFIEAQMRAPERSRVLVNGRA